MRHAPAVVAPTRKAAGETTVTLVGTKYAMTVEAMRILDRSEK
jgi:hypothetical protein